MIIGTNNQGINAGEVDKMIVNRVKKMIGIKATGDNPTDAKQLVNKQYTDTQNASTVSAISSIISSIIGSGSIAGTSIRYMLYRSLDASVSHSILAGVGGDVSIPFTGTVSVVGATVDTAGVTGLAKFDINKNGTTILSSVITIDSSEKTSRTAAAQPVVSIVGVAKGDVYTFDIDLVQTTPAKGLTMFVDFNPL